MNEEKIREIVEKVVADNMPNKEEITQKAIEAVKKEEKKENDKLRLIKKYEKYWAGDSDDERYWDEHTNNCTEYDKVWNFVGLVARTRDELREIIKARRLQREYEQWCMQYPVIWKIYIQQKYYAYYSYPSNEIKISACLKEQQQGVVYCANEEHIRTFIDKVGEQNFSKYVMGIGLPKYFLEV